MARKSKAQIEEELLAKQDEINAEAEKRVQAMLPALTAGIIAQLVTKRTEIGVEAPVSAAATGPSDQNWAQSLATAIVAAGDPKNVKRSVDPVILAQRKEAHAEMIQLLVEAYARGEKPTYTITATMWLNDTLVQPQWRDDGSKRFVDTVIRWDRTPNQAMVPHDDLAKRVMALYRRSIGSVEVEGVPDAPWLNPAAPWVFSREGIVKGRPIEAPPEMAAGGKLFDDPRMPGHSSIAERKEVAVLGSSAPRFVESSV